LLVASCHPSPHHPITASPHHPITVGATQSRKYSPLRSAAPKFWIPTLYGDSITGTFIGISTAGYDDVERHDYAATVAYAPDTERWEYDVTYNYNGLGTPIIAAELSRQWLRTQTSARHEDLAAVDVVYPIRKWRNSTTLQLGAELAHLLGESHVGIRGGIGFANTRRPQYAISAEDGVRASVFARSRFDWYSEINARTAAYKSIDAFGFAHHVVALRANGIARSNGAPFVTEVGGETDFLPVRGFASGTLYGKSAWSATAEYRIPLALVGRGSKVRPLFLDRVSGAFFYDIGGTDKATISSVGAEVTAITQILTFNATLPIRVGVAYSLRGEVNRRAYVAAGQNF
jgi:hypothetical protein